MKHINHIGPVCSLKVLTNRFLLSGKGPNLIIYDYITGEKIFERLVFNRDKIHGIEFFEETSIADDFDESKIKFAIWGGRSLSIFTLEEFKSLDFELPLLSVGDWIFHCLFANGNTLHILNSHNIVYTASVANGFELIDSKNCGWKSILYSGTLHRNMETGKVTVLAGTVMNGILVWDLEFCEIKHNLTQHEGSIFNVSSSPDGKYIISCSDDRSIKVWNMENGDLLANGWGHGSRIWGLNIYNVVEDGFSVFSCSEDCTSRIWTFKVGSDELKQEKIISAHTGRHIWSLAVNDELKLGFTGGADGKVFVTDLDETARDGYLGHRWELKDIAKECDYTLVKGELIKQYVDFGHGLLAVTSAGKIMVLKSYRSWSPLFTDERFERSCILKVFDGKSVCVLANKHGNVIFIKFNRECEVEIKEEIDLSESMARLGNILVHEYEKKYFLLLESPNPKDTLIYKEIDPETLSIKSTVLLEKPTEKVTVSSVEYDATKDILLVGCRFATMVLYKLAEDKNKPLAIYKNLFKGDTISSMKSLNDKNDCVLYLTNKDGSYHIMRINSNLDYEFLQSSRIQKGFLEGLIKLPNGDVLLYGFKSDSFFVLNETKQYEMMREICGGPHRRWFFKHWIDEITGEFQYRFIYTRASEVQIVQYGKPAAVEVLETGLHGREIRDICVVDAANEKDEKVIITGSEDTTLKLGVLDNNGNYKLHWTYREHLSGLQSIHPVNNEYIISSSAREELFVWKISECDDKQCMALESLLPPGDENPDLRIMDFDSIEVFNQNGIQSIGFLLVSVYSNSKIKLVYYEYASKKFVTLIDDLYRQCCIFHVKLVTVEKRIYVMIGSTNGYISIFDINDTITEHFQLVKDGAAEKLAKSGDMTNVEASKLGKLIIDQQVHQSSIKALDVIQLSQDKLCVVTGGDDNALIISELKPNPEEMILDLRIESFNPSAASSTITTVTAIDQNTILVGAVDQSVKLWYVQSDLTVVEDRYTTVADIGCSELAQFENGRKFVLIGGAGLSTWEI